MTVIEFAEKRLNESCLNDDDEAVLYWRAYLDGAIAQKKSTVMEWISVKDRLPEPFVSVLDYMPDATPFPIEIARRQKTGAFRSARPKGVIK